MTEFSDEEIRREAFLLWEAEGQPLWSNAYDHWFRAVEQLRRRHSAERDFGNALPTEEPDAPS
ncbi:MAG TPA: hypothetical protein VNX29_08460 [Kaistia sp.]|nr:hypothetical protein [Kaistia sp.]